MARKNYFSTSKNIIQTHEEDDTARATTARLLIDVVRSRTFSKAKELTPKPLIARFKDSLFAPKSHNNMESRYTYCSKTREADAVSDNS